MTADTQFTYDLLNAATRVRREFMLAVNLSIYGGLPEE